MESRPNTLLSFPSSSPPSFLQATQWKTFLLSHCTAFRELKEERERGWNSPSLDKWYAKRRSSVVDKNGKGDTSSLQSSLSAAATSPPLSSSSENSPNFVTYFRVVDLEQLTSRYSEHAQQTWGSYIKKRTGNLKGDTRNTLPFTTDRTQTPATSSTPSLTRKRRGEKKEAGGQEGGIAEEDAILGESFSASHHNGKTEKRGKVPHLVERNEFALAIAKGNTTDAFWAPSIAAQGRKRRLENDTVHPPLYPTPTEHTNAVGEEDNACGSGMLHSSFRQEEGSCSPYVFLDLGCAPGGVSLFLTQCLSWSGVGVTLSMKEGGIPMCQALQALHEKSVSHVHARNSSSTRFLLFDGDVTLREDSWRLQVPITPSFLCSGRSVHCEEGGKEETRKRAAQAEEATEEKSEGHCFSQDSFSSLFGGCRFSFIHGGAVQDYGQRREHFANTLSLSEHPLVTHSTESAASTKQRGGHAVSAQDLSHSDSSALPTPVAATTAFPLHHDASPHSLLSSNTMVPVSRLGEVLPWFTLLRPQLRLGLQYVAPGGSLLLVHGAPHCASFFILLHAFRLSLGDDVHIRVLETMHLGKAPVYIFLDNITVHTVDPHTTKADRCCHENEYVRRQAALLQAMDPTSSVVCPYFLCEPSSTTTTTPVENAFATTSSLLQEKEKFWLGESEEGMNAAKAGYRFVQKEMSQIWDRMRRFLQRRRWKAENTVQDS